MNAPLWLVAIAFVVYGCVGYFGVASGQWMSARIVPFEDGPKPRRPRIYLLMAGAALVGAFVAGAGHDSESGKLLGGSGMNTQHLEHLGDLQLLVFAAITYALVACWYTDVASGIVPDVFTLGALGLALLVSLLAGDYWHLASAALIGVPFVGAALLSRGRGMGWGDVKLVALGGATLGLMTACLVFAGACLVAVAIAFVRRRRSEPIAFAPYLIGAMAFAVAFPTVVP